MGAERKNRAVFPGVAVIPRRPIDVAGRRPRVRVVDFNLSGSFTERFRLGRSVGQFKQSRWDFEFVVLCLIWLVEHVRSGRVADGTRRFCRSASTRTHAFGGRLRRVSRGFAGRLDRAAFKPKTSATRTSGAVGCVSFLVHQWYSAIFRNGFLCRWTPENQHPGEPIEPFHPWKVDSRRCPDFPYRVHRS